MNGIDAFIEQLNKELTKNFSQADIYFMSSMICTTKIILKRVYLDFNVLPKIEINHSFILIIYLFNNKVNNVYVYKHHIFDLYDGYKFIKNCPYSLIFKSISILYMTRARSLSYSLDVLYPGLYIWIGSLYIMFGGCKCPANYNYIISSNIGFGIVLPNLIHVHTYFKEFKLIK